MKMSTVWGLAVVAVVATLVLSAMVQTERRVQPDSRVIHDVPEKVAKGL